MLIQHWVMYALIVGIGCVLVYRGLSIRKFEYRGQVCMLLVCLGVFFGFLKGLNAKQSMEAYLAAGRIVQEEYSLLTEAKKSPLDDTPEIESLSSQLMYHVKQLERLQKEVIEYSEDGAFRVLFPELVEEYQRLPEFSLEAVAIPTT